MPRILLSDGSVPAHRCRFPDRSVLVETPPPLAAFASSLGGAGHVDGIGTIARFSAPTGIAVDGDGNVYVADTGNHTIRRIGPDARVTTIVGVAGTRGFVAGPLPGGLTSPLAVAVRGKALYIVMPNGIAVADTRP